MNNFNTQLEDAGDLDPNGWYKITRPDNTSFIGQWIGIVDAPNNNEPPLRFLVNGEERQVKFSQVTIQPCENEACNLLYQSAPAAGGKSKKRKSKKATKKHSKKSHKKSKKRS